MTNTQTSIDTDVEEIIREAMEILNSTRTIRTTSTPDNPQETNIYPAAYSSPESESTSTETDSPVEEETPAETEEIVETQEEDTDDSEGPEDALLRENSEIIEQNSSRFSSAVWYAKAKEKTVLLAGLGGIGSFVSFMLSRVQPLKMILYDPDTIEEANLSGQLFSYANLGTSKANVCSHIARDFSGYYATFCIPRFFTSTTPREDIMICGFDNMQARKIFYNSWKSRVSYTSYPQRKNMLFIDGRLAAEKFQVFCMTGDDSYYMSLYEKEWLFSDDEADTTVCSYKQTTYMASMIGSIITNLFVNFCANQCPETLFPRDLPFITSYNAETMYLKTEK